MDAPTLSIIAAGVLIGGVAGFVMHRADFCVASAFRDLFLFRKGFMLRILLLLVISAMLLFDCARHFGWLAFYPFPLAGAISPANFIGGALFGIGMVLAGGCVFGTLYRSGAGNFPAMLAVVGLVIGSGLYAELHTTWSAFARSFVLYPGKSTLPQILSIDPTWLVGPVAAISGVVLYRWARAGLMVKSTAVEGYIQPWAAGLILALLGVVSWMVSGMPMGITTSYAKGAAMIESSLAPAHYSSLAYFRTTPLDIVLPSGLSLCGGPGATLDGISLVQFPLILGVVAGSFISAVSIREFHFRLRIPPAQLAAALLGGIVMGLASRMAPGCNVWHVMGGLPIFSVPGILFTAGLIPGAWIGGRVMTRII